MTRQALQHRSGLDIEVVVGEPRVHRANGAHLGDYVLGMLPCFMADRHADLVRLLPDDFRETLSYWMVVREESLLQPAVAAVPHALRSQTNAYRESLLGLSATRTGMG